VISVVHKIPSSSGRIAPAIFHEGYHALIHLSALTIVVRL
jgi:hypothetical protein